MRNKMAPFKLKFRMGSSRSTSQEHDPDPQVSEALLGPAQQQQQQQQQQPHGAHHPPQQQPPHVLQHHQQHAQHTQSPLLGIGASTSTIDSTDCHSLSSASTNERKSLLPSQHKTNTMRLGYLNQCGSNDTTTLGSQLPKTPPPSYEHVLEENTRLAHSFEYAHRQQQHHQQPNAHHPHLRQHSGQLSADGVSEHASGQHSRLSSQQNSRSSTLFTSLERLTLGSSGQCTDPECRENLILLSQDRRLRRQQEIDNEAGDSGAELLEVATNDIRNNNDANDDDDEGNNDTVARPERVGCDEAQDIGDDDNRKESIDSTELLLSRDNMSDYNGGDQAEDASGCSGGGGMLNDGNEACGGDGGSDDGLCHEKNCPDDDHYNDGLGQEQTDSDEENQWQQQQMCYQQHQQEQQQQAQYDSSVISNKSSKEIYKDLAKQWGITCKMSDGCRCMDCQSNYFDCEFDHNEHQKTDGGLGAGTPMFISEVMHGSACTIL